MATAPQIRTVPDLPNRTNDQDIAFLAHQEYIDNPVMACQSQAEQMCHIPSKPGS